MHLDQELVDALAGHRASNLEALEDEYWKLQCELVQAIGAFRRMARKHSLKFAEIPIFPERGQSGINTPNFCQKEAEYRRQLEEMPPEVRALGLRCLEIDELFFGIQCKLLKSMVAEELNVESIAKRLAMLPQLVSEISNSLQSTGRSRDFGDERIPSGQT